MSKEVAIIHHHYHSKVPDMGMTVQPFKWNQQRSEIGERLLIVDIPLKDVLHQEIIVQLWS